MKGFEKMKNIIIIGAGPAGISAALYTARSGIETMVITHGKSALLKTEKIENYYGFYGSGEELYKKGIESAVKLGVNVIDDEVVSVEYSEKFGVSTTGGKYYADAVIIAVGNQRNAPLIDGLKEYEGKGVSYCAVCDGFFYRGKNVAVIGSGAYAKNEADELIPLAGNVTVLTNGEETGAEFDCQVMTDKIVRIDGDGVVSFVVFENGDKLDVSGVFVAVGTAGGSDLAKKLGIVTDKDKISVNSAMETNIPGVYAAGDCTGGMLQIAKAVHDGAEAAMSVIKYVRSLKG